MFIKIILLTDVTAIDMSVQEYRLNTTEPNAKKEGVWGLEVLVGDQVVESSTIVIVNVVIYYNATAEL